MPDDVSLRPFRIDVPDEVLHDLHQRLTHTRWPEAETVDDWSQGAPLSWIQDMCGYWADGYDWRTRENAAEPLRPVPHDHRRARHPLRPPTIAARRRAAAGDHPWLAGLDRRVPQGHRTADRSHGVGGTALDAFHVICPALPGFGFSGKPAATGWGVERIAAAWATLMGRLGYDQYFAQGGDWGSAVTTRDRRPGRRALRGNPHHVGHGHPATGRWRADARRAASDARRSALPDLGLRLLQAAGHPAADDRVRPGRLTGGAGGLDPREVLGVDRLRRPP